MTITTLFRRLTNRPARARRRPVCSVAAAESLETRQLLSGTTGDPGNANNNQNNNNQPAPDNSKQDGDNDVPESCGETFHPDFFPTYEFKVDFGTNDSKGFDDVDGLNVEVEVIEYQEGDDAVLPRKRLGLFKFGDITLKKGYTVTKELQEWWEACREGAYDRRDLDRTLQYEFNLKYFPKPKWKFNEFDGGDSNVVREEIVFVVEDMQIAR